MRILAYDPGGSSAIFREAERLREARDEPLRGVVERHAAARLGREGRHGAALHAARVDAREGGDVRVDVERGAVHRHASRDADADRRELAPRRPYADASLLRRGAHAEVRGDPDDRAFEGLDVAAHADAALPQAQDRIRDELA